MDADSKLQTYKNEVIILYALNHHIFDKILKNKNIIDNSKKYHQQNKDFLKTRAQIYYNTISNENNMSALLTSLAINDFCEDKENKKKYEDVCEKFSKKK